MHHNKAQRLAIEKWKAETELDRVEAENAKLREFYLAATAPGVTLKAVHSYDCWGHMAVGDDCACGAGKRQARLSAASTALGWPSSNPVDTEEKHG